MESRPTATTSKLTVMCVLSMSWYDITHRCSRRPPHRAGGWTGWRTESCPHSTPYLHQRTPAARHWSRRLPPSRWAYTHRNDRNTEWTLHRHRSLWMAFHLMAQCLRAQVRAQAGLQASQRGGGGQLTDHPIRSMSIDQIFVRKTILWKFFYADIESIKLLIYHSNASEKNLPWQGWIFRSFAVPSLRH